MDPSELSPAAWNAPRMIVRLPSKSLVTPEAGVKETEPVWFAARISMSDGPVSLPVKMFVAPASGAMTSG